MRNIGGRRLTNALENKLDLDFRSGKERTAWYRVDGKKQVRVTAPKVHGSKDVPVGTAGSIQKQLHLTRQQFLDLVACPLSSGDYEEIIRGKIAQGIL